MKTILGLLISCGCLLAAEDVGVVVTARTNRSGSVTVREFFTRDGQTNLLRSTTRTNGVVRSRFHRFYHAGKHAADHLAGPGGFIAVSSFNGFELHLTCRSNLLDYAWIGDEHGNVLDIFYGTNGLLAPIPTYELRKYMNEPLAAKPEDEKDNEK